MKKLFALGLIPALIPALLAAAFVPGTARGQSTDAADGVFLARDRFREPDGEKMYRRVCSACHMADAKGAEGAGRYPALAANARLGSAQYPTLVIVKGLNGMPAIGNQMSDQQVADVVNYIRTHFGNSYAADVKPEDVKALR
jgi:mono/diheme cytochrome c family protein